MSTWSTTTLTLCPGSQRQRWHAIFENIKKFVSFFYFFQNKLIYHVNLVNDYADTRFSRISSRKRKISRNRFCLFIWGPCRVFLSRKMYRKSRFTVPLNGQSRICLYFKESSTVLTVKVRACHLYNFKKCLVIAVCFYACSLMHNDNVD